MNDVELPSWAAGLCAAARSAGEDVAAGLDLAGKYGSHLPRPGHGRTAVRWRLLADVCAQDLTAGRILEAHSDALAILAEAGEDQPDGTWGVFAADAPGARLDAQTISGAALLNGTKWCRPVSPRPTGINLTRILPTSVA